VGTIAGTRTTGEYALAATDFLTEAQVRCAKPKKRPYKLRDGGGLYLLITPADVRLWRLRYKLQGRESMVALGTYPATSLKAARARRAELRGALESGRDPTAERRAERASSSNTFEAIAREWLAKQPRAPREARDRAPGQAAGRPGDSVRNRDGPCGARSHRGSPRGACARQGDEPGGRDRPA